WCSRARRSSSRCLGQAGWVVLGALDFGRRQAVPSAAKARRALRTACEEQPREAAIRAGRWPRSLARRIWQRRRVKASRERSPSRSAARSGTERVRTNNGGFMHHSTRPTPSQTLSFGNALGGELVGGDAVAVVVARRALQVRAGEPGVAAGVP